VTHIPTAALADQARKHLGDAGPINTCVSNGPEKWTHELGLPILGTASVTEYVKLAKAGTHGYRYHDGVDGLSRGHIGVWTHEALGSDQDEHVCVVDDVEGALWRGIGSGTPSHTVARQPSGGGLNPKTVLRGYVVAPTETAAAAKPAAAHPSTPVKSSTYVVKSGDYLARIARQHDTSVKALLALNPALPNRRSADFHIARANLVVVGQKIHLP
jgi:LysM repeat protein